MDPRVKDAVAFINEHLRQRISIAAVAAEAGLPVSKFTRLFRRDLGMTPSAYVNRLRMAEKSEPDRRSGRSDRRRITRTDRRGAPGG